MNYTESIWHFCPNPVFFLNFKKQPASLINYSPKLLSNQSMDSYFYRQS